jgi:hypothetical protein
MPDGFLSYGAGKAASYKHDFQRDIDRLYQREAYAAQVKAEREKKAQYWGQLMQEQNATNPSITKDLEEKYKQWNNEIADFAINNPGFETDVNKMQQMHSLTDRYLNNDLILEDKQGHQEFQKLKQAYNNGDITEDQWAVEMERYEAWMNDYKSMDQEGNKIGPYVFSNPKQISVNEIVKNANDQLTQVTRAFIKEGRIIKEQTTEDLYGFSDTYYQGLNPDEKASVDRQFKSFKNDPRFANVYETPQEMLADMIKHGEPELLDDTGYDPMELIRARARATAGTEAGKYIPYYWREVYNKYLQNGEVGESVHNLAFTEFGGVDNYLSVPPGGKKFYVYDKDQNLMPVELSGSIVSKGGGRIFSATPGDAAGSMAFAEATVAITTDVSDSNVVVSSNGKKIYLNGKEISYDSLSKRDQDLIEVNEETGKFSKIEDPTYAEKLESLGFTKKSITLPAEINIPGMSSEKIVADAWVGQVVTKASFGERERDTYDRARGNTSEAMSAANRAGIYSDSGLDELQALSFQGNTRAEDMAKERINRTIGNDLLTQWGIRPDDVEWQAGDEIGHWYYPYTENGEKYVVRHDHNSGSTNRVKNDQLYDILKR